MHRLATLPGDDSIDDITLVEQPPAPVLFLSSATTDITTLASTLDLPVHKGWKNKIRALPISVLQHPAQIDHYLSTTATTAKLIVVRMIGSKSHWAYGFEKTQIWQKEVLGRDLIVLSGTEDTAFELHEIGSIGYKKSEILSELMNTGGVKNISTFIVLLDKILNNYNFSKQEIKVHRNEDPLIWNWENDAGTKVGVILYKALYESGDVSLAICINRELRAQGIIPRILWVSTLKNKNINTKIEKLFKKENVKAIITSTSFSIIDSNNNNTDESLWDKIDVPVFQILTSSSQRKVWLESSTGLSPIDLSMQIALPEIDGRIITRPCAFKTITKCHEYLSTAIHKLEPDVDNIKWLSKHVKSWIRLQELNQKDKKVCLVLANYPVKNGRLANGVGLDTPASAVEILSWLKEIGIDLGDKNIPKNSFDLMKQILSQRTNSFESHNKEPLEYLSIKTYKKWWLSIPEKSRTAIIDRWGRPEEAEDLDKQGFAIHGIRFGNLCLLIQPSRGYDPNSVDDLHSPDLVPPHRYLAQYLWIKEIHKTDLIIHLGKHGSLEWLPGKGVGISKACYPDIAIGHLPHIYPFIVNDPGEGSQAKRRSQAVIIDHMTPPLGLSGLYGNLVELEGILEEYFDSISLSSDRSKILENKLIEHLKTNCWPHLSKYNETDRLNSDKLFSLFSEVEAYICEIKESQIRTGLHIFGKKQEDEKLIELMLLILKTPTSNRIGITQWIANELNLTLDPWKDDIGNKINKNDLDILSVNSEKKFHINGDAVEWLDNQALLTINYILSNHANFRRSDSQNLIVNDVIINNIKSKSYPLCDYIVNDLWPRLINSSNEEKKNFIKSLNGKRVTSGPSGAPTRGRPEVLPTGRNFYSVDLRGLPTEASWELGKRSANNILKLHIMENGEHLKKIAISVWGTATMRNGGEEICQLLYLIGVRPVWDGPTRRIIDLEVIPLNLLERPRVDVFLRISGLFRDAFPHLIDYVNEAQRLIASLDEPKEMNPLAAERRKRINIGRIYGSAPGAYGAGLQAYIDNGTWDKKSDLAEAYISWSQWRYEAADSAIKDREGLEHNLKDIQVVLHNQDNKEHDILDSDDYYQFHGGLSAAVEYKSGKLPTMLIGDNSRLDRPRINNLSKEIDKVIRSRILNPRWINGMKSHGYKGAFEMSASLDYMFAYDATTGEVQDWSYSKICETWLKDQDTLNFLREYNPWVLRDISERLLEAINRELWKEATAQEIDYIKSLVNLADNDIEQGKYENRE